MTLAKTAHNKVEDFYNSLPESIQHLRDKEVLNGDVIQLLNESCNRRDEATKFVRGEIQLARRFGSGEAVLNIFLYTEEKWVKLKSTRFPVEYSELIDELPSITADLFRNARLQKIKKNKITAVEKENADLKAELRRLRKSIGEE